MSAYVDSDPESTLPPAYEDLPPRKQMPVPMCEYSECVNVYALTAKLMDSLSVFSDIRSVTEQQNMDDVGQP